MRKHTAYLILVCMLCGPGLVRAQQAKDCPAEVPRVFEIVSKIYQYLEGRLRGSETAERVSESEFQKWRSNIRNYDIELKEYSGRIYVTLAPKSFNGRRINGGVDHYVFNETTGEVVEHTAER